MWRRAAAHEQGSVSAVGVALLMVLLLLVVAVLDREWVNYMMKLVEQTADLAAEAGAKAHVINATVTAKRTHAVVKTKSLCVRTDLQGKCDLTMDVDYVDEWQHTLMTVQRPEDEFDSNAWRALFECTPDDNPYTGWACSIPHVESYTLVFTDKTGPRARQTFERNWHDLPHARVRPEFTMVSQDPDQRTVYVAARLEVDSLFGLYRTETILLAGRSVVQGKTLTFR